MELFTKDGKLPPELRPLSYDVNSVTHFGDREFSKNGHRTIIFKDHNVVQNRRGLSELDVRKIEVIYGPECQKRDRQEKIDLCQNYPGVARRKRQVDLHLFGPSLRVNREITAPPEHNDTGETTNSLKDLGIEIEAKDILDKANDLAAVILKEFRRKYCNDTASETTHNADVLGILDLVADYARSIEDHRLKNPIEFCLDTKLEQYKVARCGYHGYSMSQKRTRVGNVRHSTQHRPVYSHSTKKVHGSGSVYEKEIYRAGNGTEAEAEKVRRKRSIEVSVKLDEANKTGNDPNKVVTAEAATDEEFDATAGEKSDFKVTPMMNVDTENSVKGLPSRRRFQDFSVHERKPNNKAQSHESDLSLELKEEKRTKKRIVKKKHHPIPKGKVTSIW